MKFIVLFCALVGLSSAAIKCYEGKDYTTAVLKDCDTDVKNCSYKQDSKDKKYMEYKCGSCAEGTVGCKNCTGKEDAPCNALPEVHYQCYKGKEKANCTALKGHESCFMSASNYTGNDDKVKKGGCGTCKLASLNKTICSDCNKELCNGAITMFSFMAPLVAIMYWLS